MFEQTAYDLGRVPDEMMVRVLEQDITTTLLPYAGEILNFIDSRIRRKKPPKYYEKAYYEKVVKERGLLTKNIKKWYAFAPLILLPFPIMIGISFPAKVLVIPTLLIYVLIPYCLTGISYVAFIYTLRNVKYWKTFFHFIITALFTCSIITLNGNFLEVIRYQPLEAILGTIVGFYIGSFAPYIIVKTHLRTKFPVHFHQEYTGISLKKWWVFRLSCEIKVSLTMLK